MKMFMSMMLVLTTSFTVVAQDKPMATTYKVDSSASSVKWVGTKLKGQHAGTVSTKDGFFTYQGDIITAGEINVDMSTMTVTDIPVTDEMNAKLLGHLKSPDFFNVEKYPDAKLVITGSEKTKTGLKVKGNLTFIGKTNPIEFDAIVNKTESQVVTKSGVKLDRTKWGLKYNSGNFFKDLGDKLINNEFTIEVDILAKK